MVEATLLNMLIKIPVSIGLQKKLQIEKKKKKKKRNMLSHKPVVWI